MKLVQIFVAGGLFCLFGEFLWARTKLGIRNTLIICIMTGVLLDAAGVLGGIIGLGQEGFTVTIYGAGASIYDGVMGSLKDNGIQGVVQLTNFYFLRFAALIACTVVMAAALGFLHPGEK